MSEWKIALSAAAVTTVALLALPWVFKVFALYFDYVIWTIKV